LFHQDEPVVLHRVVVDLLEVVHWDYCQRQVLQGVEAALPWVHLTVEDCQEVVEILVVVGQILGAGVVVHQ
jgi:hypothetical protein